jgi:hypothetical protein
MLILGFLFGSVALFAQVHGPAPLVNSYTGKSMSVGPAPSVLSVGPRGWATGPCNATGCMSPYFTPSINFQNGTVQFGQHYNLGAGRRGHHRPGNYGGGYAYSYGYPYPVYVPVEPAQEENQQAEPPAPTLYERRPEVRLAPNPTPNTSDESRYGEHYLDQREQDQSAAATASSGGHHNMSPVSDEQIPVTIVYKDGREQEIQNYAIVGDTLYDLGNSFARKIKLSDLNLKQTIQKNDERGVEFSLPSSYKPVS